MPAVSKAQQRFMGMVHAVQKGDMDAPSKEVEKAADSMTDKDAKDYVSTSHKGLPNKKESMKITKERLKELVKEVMTEESEYQAFFAKALEKAGKGINDMSDEEKKAFFNKIDTAWNGKGEKSESVSEDIAAELPKAIIPSAVKQKLELAIDKIKDAKLNPTQKLQLVAQVVDSLGIDKTQLGTIANKIRSKMESINEEDINWGATENAIINFLKMNTKILDKRVKDRDTDGVKKGLQSIIDGLTNAQRSLKLK